MAALVVLGRRYGGAENRKRQIESVKDVWDTERSLSSEKLQV